MALLMCLFVADRTGRLKAFWLDHVVGIGGTLGSLGAISVAGLAVGMRCSPPLTWRFAKACRKFTLWFAPVALPPRCYSNRLRH